jgi:uncharacterized membrane protein YcaP (DUF421 family)
MFFSGWAIIGRTILVGTLAYLSIIFLLRFSGKRTLSKMNAFDLVVTVALGSTLATILLSKNVALAEGVTAFITLVALQYVIAWLSVRSEKISSLVKATPALLFYRGTFLDKNLKAERVTEGEVISAIRAQGIPRLNQVEAVVLETDGSFTVIKLSLDGPATALRDLSTPSAIEHQNNERPNERQDERQDHRHKDTPSG